MPRILIIVNAEVKEGGKIKAASPVTERMVLAIQQAIAQDSPSLAVEVLPTATLGTNAVKRQLQESDLLYCPLTIQLPPWFNFPAQNIYKACQDIPSRRRWVEENLAYKTSIGNSWLGDLWLPIVWTTKEPMYAGIIGEGAIPNFYEQPVNLNDNLRKSLYGLAEKLLDSLAALPAVYLLQFSLLEGEIIFDRLWPFPAAPAIASLRVQKPDLYTCHWRCLTNQPILS